MALVIYILNRWRAGLQDLCLHAGNTRGSLLTSVPAEASHSGKLTETGESTKKCLIDDLWGKIKLTNRLLYVVRQEKKSHLL